MAKYTQEEAKRIMNDVASGHVTLMCEKHLWGPGNPNKPLPPTSGCKGCINALYMHLYARTSLDKQEEFLEQLTEAVHAAASLEDSGKWDIELHKPQVTVEEAP